MTYRNPNLPTIEFLKECFDLLENGVLLWRIRPVHHFSSPITAKVVNKARAGKVAGIIGKDGYTLIRVANRLITAHSIVWAMTKGNWPQKELDHIDRNRNNNRISNLREATREQNMANAKLHRDNRYGYTGVNEYLPGRFRARININGKNVHLGIFIDAKSAGEAYRAKRISLMGEFAR